MAEIVRAVMLGLLQGLTEFLPVSSSGHLVIAQALFGDMAETLQEPGAAWIIALHAATALATVLVYWRDVWEIARDGAVGFVVMLYRPCCGGRTDRYKRFPEAMLLLLSAVPAGIVGLAFKDQLEALTANPAVAGAMLLVTGTLLWLTRRRKEPTEGRQVGVLTAVVMGCAQAVALIPGISRSGATISSGLLCGARAEAAVRFSFLMVLLPILGASLLEVRDLQPGAVSYPHLALGFAVAGVSGYVALRWLIGVIRRGRLHRFAWYCWALGLLTLTWALFLRG